MNGIYSLCVLKYVCMNGSHSVFFFICKFKSLWLCIYSSKFSIHIQADSLRAVDFFYLNSPVVKTVTVHLLKLT